MEAVAVMNRGGRMKKKNNKKSAVVNIADEKEVLFHEDRKTIQELIAPEGLSDDVPEYIILNDGGVNVYTMFMYIHKMPKATVFASTFASLFNFPGITSNVFVSPLSSAKSQNMVDKRVRTLNTESYAAHESGDPNRIRKMDIKLQKANRWAEKIEEGDNGLYSVRFLFTLQAESEEKLFRKAGDLRMKAMEKDVELVSCYGVQVQALMSTYPLNRTVPFEKTQFIKAHTFDRGSLGDIFNHTSSSFIHRNGVFMGHYLNTMQAFFFDPMDKAHDGYGAIFAGGTGTGKSATIKMLQSRLGDFGFRFRTIDIESRSTRGEYALTSEACGGVVYEVKPNSPNIPNPFDLNVEMEYDETTGVEYPTLRVAEKRAYLVDLLLAMITIGSSQMPSIELREALTSILDRIIGQMYEERKIYDGKPESLYQTEGENFLNSGHTKKAMPTMSEAFKKVLVEQYLNDNPLHAQAYQLLVDSLGKQVNGVYYGKKSMRFFTKEEYDSFEVGDYGRRYTDYNKEKEQVVAVIGSKAYFDGETTMKAVFETPYVDYDMSQVPKEDRPWVLLVLMGYMEENDIKLNSANPYRTTPLVVLIDELHILFPYEDARRCIDRFYRTARKRWVCPWVATQSLADIGDNKKYDDMEGIYKNTDTYFIFRHKTTDRKFFKENTSLTDSQIDRLFQLGVDPKDPEVTAEQKKRRAGEICVIDSGRVAFVKVDYLEASEAAYVETNVENIKRQVKKETA